MPRNEGFLDPGAGPLASFAWDLRALREKSGKVPYRVLAKRAGFCASTLSVAASGAKLPSLDVTLAYVQACGGEPDVWRERWNALAAQLPPANHTPTADAGLEIAPPYDADEHGEPPPLLDAGPIGLPLAPLVLDSSESAHPELAAEAVGGDRVSVSREDVRLLSVSQETASHETVSQAAEPSAPVGGGGGRPSGGPWWRPRLPMISIGRVTTVALTLATAILGMKVLMPEAGNSAPATSAPPASASQTNTPMQQADALYALIYQATPYLSDTTDAIWDVADCRNLSNAQSRLRAIARERQVQVEQLATLDVSRLPDHSRLTTALKRAWSASAQSDTAFANIAADLQTGCTSGAVVTDLNYQQADAYLQAAAAAKSEAAQLWNTYADALTQLHIKPGAL